MKDTDAKVGTPVFWPCRTGGFWKDWKGHVQALHHSDPRYVFVSPLAYNQKPFWARFKVEFEAPFEGRVFFRDDKAGIIALSHWDVRNAFLDSLKHHEKQRHGDRALQDSKYFNAFVVAVNKHAYTLEVGFDGIKKRLSIKRFHDDELGQRQEIGAVATTFHRFAVKEIDRQQRLASRRRKVQIEKDNPKMAKSYWGKKEPKRRRKFGQ